MGPSAFAIHIDDAAVQALFNAAPALVQTSLRQLIEGAAIDVQREMRLAAPIAVTGNLRRSIQYAYTAALLQAVISPSVDYADDVESGTGPHYVSVAPGSSLRAWALQKGLNPYALRNSIAKKGTKAHPFVKPTYDLMKPLVEQNIGAGITAVIEGMNK